MKPVDRRVFQEWLLILTALFAIVWAVIRACVQSITMDEADTYAWFVATSNVWYPFSNNHILNTLLMWVSTHAFGPSVIAIRAPALLGATFYVGICYFLCRSITERFSIRLPVFICLTYNPFIFDYMVAARGYGLANAFLLAAIAVPVWHRVKSRPSLRQSCVLASLALGLSFSANYSFAFAGLAVFFAITAWAIRRRAGEPVLHIVGLCALPGLFVALLLCGYPMMHWWGYGYDIGAHSLREMRQSLVQSSLYQLDPRFRATGWYKAMSFLRPLLPPLLVVLCLSQIVATRLDGSWREDTHARWLGRFAAALAGIVTLCVLMHWLVFRLFRVPLPLGRAGIFLLPLCTLLEVSSRHRRPGPWSHSGSAAASSLCPSAWLSTFCSACACPILRSINGTQMQRKFIPCWRGTTISTVSPMSECSICASLRSTTIECCRSERHSVSFTRSLPTLLPTNQSMS